MSKGEKLQYKVQGLYEKISKDLYLNRDDFEANGQRYNSALLFGTLTELSKGNMLLFGEYGGGKTTSAEYLNAVFNGLPLDLVKRVAIRGNPQLTEEKMVGRPHYGKMHQGEEDVVWQHFVMVGPKIFDEFNRIPESNQAVVLNGVDRGEWNYSEQIIYIGIIPLVLVLESAFTKQKRLLNLRRFGLALVLAGLLLAVRNPIAEIPYKLNIPILSDLQPTRLSYLITFGLSILTAVGLQNLIISFNKSFKNTMVIITGLGAVFLTLLIYSSKFSSIDKIVSQRNLIWPVLIWGLFILSYVLLFFVKRFNLATARLNLMGFMFIGIAIVDLFRFGWKFTPFSPKEYLYPITPAIKFLQDNMRENDRYMTLDRRILPPNANIIYKLKSIEGYDPIYSKDYARLIAEMETGRNEVEPVSFGRIIRPTNYKSPVTALLGVRYLLSLADLEEKGWAKVFQEGETKIYERR